jgi:hypothetical protein
MPEAIPPVSGEPPAYDRTDTATVPEPSVRTGGRQSSYELRQKVFDAVVADLLGPADGPEEEFAGAGIRDRYLLGQLLPRGSMAEPEQFEDITRPGESAPEEDQPDTETPPARTLMPS